MQNRRVQILQERGVGHKKIRILGNERHAEVKKLTAVESMRKLDDVDGVSTGKDPAELIIAGSN